MKELDELIKEIEAWNTKFEKRTVKSVKRKEVLKDCSTCAHAVRYTLQKYSCRQVAGLNCKSLKHKFWKSQLEALYRCRYGDCDQKNDCLHGVLHVHHPNCEKECIKGRNLSCCMEVE